MKSFRIFRKIVEPTPAERQQHIDRLAVWSKIDTMINTDGWGVFTDELKRQLKARDKLSGSTAKTFEEDCGYVKALQYALNLTERYKREAGESQKWLDDNSPSINKE